MSLVAPLPRNMKLAGVRGGRHDAVKLVESDVFNVAERLRHVSPDLRIVYQDGHSEPFVVMEDCVDGEMRFVARYAELDARIIEDVIRMRAIPFAERWAESCKRVDAENKALEQRLYESEEFDRAAWDLQMAIRKEIA